MKHGHLRAVAHSLVDSLASGVSLLTGFYDLRVYEDAARSSGGVLTVDLLNGRVLSGSPSPDLVRALQHVPAEFDRLGHAKGVARTDCRVALAVFRVQSHDRGFTLVIEDRRGRGTETDYHGVPARRVREVDPLGRIRLRAIRRR